MTELRALSEGRIPLINFDNLGWETNNQNRIHKSPGHLLYVRLSLWAL